MSKRFLTIYHIGTTENARPDIARLDKTAPYRNGGHRETWQSGTTSQGWTLRDLSKRHHIARVDIAILGSLCE